MVNRITPAPSDLIDTPAGNPSPEANLIRPGGGLFPAPFPTPLPGPIPTPAPSPAPTATTACDCTVSSINPTQGTVLTTLSINGSNFKPTSAACTADPTALSVSFGDSHPGGAIGAQVLSATDTQIMVTVPNGAKTSTVTVTNTRGKSASAPGLFTILPTISDASPMRGGAGTPVTVFGTGLYNSPQFFFSHADDDIPAPFSVPPAGQLDRIQIATPPSVKAGKTYKIKVITKNGGTAKSMFDFLVTASTPQVGGFTPKSGPPGTPVTITATPGTRFEGITQVSFLANPDAIGRARRIFLKAGEFKVSGDLARLECLVPEGAVTGKIKVINDSGSGSTTSFRVPLSTPAALAGRINANQGVELSWRDTTTTESGFKLERAMGIASSDAAFLPLVNLPRDNVSFTDTSAPLNQIVTYRIKSFNTKDGDSVASNPVIATPAGALQLNPVRLLFTTTRDGANPAPQNLLIEKGAIRPGEQAWVLDSTAAWLNVRPLNGVTPFTATVSVDAFGLKSGRYTGVITARTPSVDSVISTTVELVVNAPAGAITIELVGPQDAS